MSELTKMIGFIGAGNMTEAILGALVKTNDKNKAYISACDINIDRLGYMSATYGIDTTSEIEEVYRRSDVVVLSVKPQAMEDVLKVVAACRKPADSRKLIISVAAGIKTETYEACLYENIDEPAQKNIPVIRVMPNTPSLVLSGMSGMCKNRYTNADDVRIATAILSSMGKVIEVSEDKMDAVTAISGSGPAYFYYFIEAMIKEGENLGLTYKEAETLAVTTMKGAADLLESSDDTPAELRRKVTSPGGTTEAAIRAFDEFNINENIRNGVSAAARRSKELS